MCPLQNGLQLPGHAAHAHAQILLLIIGGQGGRKGGIGEGRFSCRRHKGHRAYAGNDTGTKTTLGQICKKSMKIDAGIRLPGGCFPDKAGCLAADAGKTFHQLPRSGKTAESFCRGSKGILLILPGGRFIQYVRQGKTAGFAAQTNMPQAVQNAALLVQQIQVSVLAHEFQHQSAGAFIHKFIPAGKGNAQDPVQPFLLYGDEPAADEPLAQQHAEGWGCRRIFRCFLYQLHPAQLVVDMQQQPHPAAVGTVAVQEYRILIRLLHPVYASLQQGLKLPGHKPQT